MRGSTDGMPFGLPAAVLASLIWPSSRQALALANGVTRVDGAALQAINGSSVAIDFDRRCELASDRSVTDSGSSIYDRRRLQARRSSLAENPPEYMKQAARWSLARTILSSQYGSHEKHIIYVDAMNPWNSIGIATFRPNDEWVCKDLQLRNATPTELFYFYMRCPWSYLLFKPSQILSPQGKFELERHMFSSKLSYENDKWILAGVRRAVRQLRH